MRLGEASLFLLLAGAAHVAALSAIDLPSGSEAADTSMTLTLAASSQDLSDLVRQWDSPPEVASAPPAPESPVAPSDQVPPRPATSEASVTQSAPPTALTPPPAQRETDLQDPGLPPPKDIFAGQPPGLDAPEPEVSPAPQPADHRATPRLSTPEPMAAQRPAALPEIDTRLPALRGIETVAPVALPVPNGGAAPVTAAQPKAPDRPEAPQLQGAPQSRPALPEVDVATAASPQAPARSLRPSPRPERLAPPPVERQTQPAKPKAAPKPKAQAQSAPPRAATGTTKAKPATKPKAQPKPGVSKQAIAKWQSGIASALARANRPPRTSATGRVTLSITVAPNGRLSGVSVTRSSGNSTLDKAAVANVKRARFPRAPNGFGQTATVRFTYDFTR
jgi:protein TonB